MNERPELPLPCIICGRKLQFAIAGYGVNQPYAGTAFSTHGHYGSTVYDEMSGRHLEVNICDGCMRLKAAENLIIEVTPPHVAMPPPNFTIWRPCESE